MRINNKIGIYSLVVIEALLMLASNCKKDVEDATQTPEPTQNSCIIFTSKTHQLFSSSHL